MTRRHGTIPKAIMVNHILVKGGGGLCLDGHHGQSDFVRNGVIKTGNSMRGILYEAIIDRIRILESLFNSISLTHRGSLLREIATLMQLKERAESMPQFVPASRLEAEKHLLGALSETPGKLLH
jgi:hypothetical protein